MARIITEKQNLTYLKWSHVRTSSGTAGTYLKSESMASGKKIYYKLSYYDSEKGIIGHECVNEIIVDRLLGILWVEHLEYELIHADVSLDGAIYDTWLCASADFKEKGETKAALDHYYQINKKANESHYDFCRERGWQDYIDTMLVVDYLILNRDRHGANIEVLRNAKKKSIRIAPLFDHGLSLLCTCFDEKAIRNFDVMADQPCQNFIGSRSTYENLSLVGRGKRIFTGKLIPADREKLFADLDNVISKEHMNQIWEMIWKRWCCYEKLFHSG